VKLKISILLIVPSVLFGQQIGNIVTIRNNKIYPSNTVAEITQLADTAATTQVALAQAQAVAVAANLVSNELAEIEVLENARNATGYIRAFVESFSPGIEADTNLTASIIKLEAAGTTESNALWDVYTYFSEDPGNWPVVRTSGSLMRTNAWDNAAGLGAVITNIIVGATEYECYRNRIALPLNTTSMFFRVYADINGGGTNKLYFPVQNGISVNGCEPLTATVIDGTNTMEWIGGIRVQ
jgi:hypothetical protein